MKSQMINLMLFISLVLQAGCDLTLKKKNHQMLSPAKPIPVENNSKNNSKKHRIETKKNTSTKGVMSHRDSEVIISYYADMANEIVRKDMISHTKVSKKQAKKLMLGKIIPRGIQVMPLPIALEKKLSLLSLNMIRIQVGVRVILMDVKSRRILAIIKI